MRTTTRFSDWPYVQYTHAILRKGTDRMIYRLEEMPPHLALQFFNEVMGGNTNKFELVEMQENPDVFLANDPTWWLMPAYNEERENYEFVNFLEN